MRHIFLLPLLLAAGCATGGRPYAPVRDIAYQALGAEPFWTLVIGDDRIVLGSSSFEGERSWRSEHQGSTVTVESRPGPCETEGEEVYEDDVRVIVGDQSLTGCGGRLLERAPR